METKLQSQVPIWVISLGRLLSWFDRWALTAYLAGDKAVFEGQPSSCSRVSDSQQILWSGSNSGWTLGRPSFVTGLFKCQTAS